MGVRLILCRLKDDHSVIHEVGESALTYFPDWEPVPDDQREAIEAENSGLTTPGAAEVKPPEDETSAGRKTNVKAAKPVVKEKE